MLCVVFACDSLVAARDSETTYHACRRARTDRMAQLVHVLIMLNDLNNFQVGNVRFVRLVSY